MGVANYQAQDSDELAFNAGDTAKVLRKLSDSGTAKNFPVELLHDFLFVYLVKFLDSFALILLHDPFEKFSCLPVVHFCFEII